MGRMIMRNVRPDLRIVNDALKKYRDSIGKITQRHHYINEARLVHFAFTGRSQAVSETKPVTRVRRKLYARVVCVNSKLIREGVDYQLRKLVCRQIAEKQKGNSST